MSEATELAGATTSRDPAVGLAAVASLQALLESLEALQVGNARDQGWSWQQIADELGVSKQAVSKWITAGKFPEPVKVAGRVRLYLRDQVEPYKPT